VARVPATLEKTYRAAFRGHLGVEPDINPQRDLEFIEMASNNEPEGSLKVIDLGKLLVSDPSIEGGGSIFQLNGKAGIYVFRAESPKQRQQIIALIKLVMDRGTRPKLGDQVAPTAAKTGAFSADRLLAGIEEAFQSDNSQLNNMEIDLDARARTMTKLVEELKVFESQRAMLARELRHSERTNEELVSKLADMENKATEATQRLEVLQSRVFTKLEDMMQSGSVGCQSFSLAQGDLSNTCFFLPRSFLIQLSQLDTRLQQARKSTEQRGKVDVVPIGELVFSSSILALI
jgi:hypothetical protein